MPEFERRYFNTEELRATKDGDKNKLEGYAALFNSMSEDLGGFREKISVGAFKKSLKKADVRALWNHDPNYVLGRISSKTLKLKEDDIGLHMVNTPPETTWARDLMTSIERGDISQMSFGFRVINDAWEVINNENVRTLLEVDLIDVSPVSFPAYNSTSVGVRSNEPISEIDFNTLNKIIVRAKMNLPFLEKDHDFLNEVIEKLSSLPTQDGNNDKNEPTLVIARSVLLKTKMRRY